MSYAPLFPFFNPNFYSFMSDSNSNAVICTVYNHTSDVFTYSGNADGQNWANGTFEKGPNSINANTGSTGQAIFTIDRAHWYSDGGATNYVKFNLPTGNSGQMVFMFNYPYYTEGSGYNGNCWFYVVFTGSSASSPISPLAYYVTIETNFPMSVDPPYVPDSTSDNMTVSVSIYKVA